MKLFVVAGLCRDSGNRSCELAVLGIIGIRNDLHRRHYINRKIEGWTTSHGIGNVRAVHQRAALSIASALEIDVSIRSANNPGNEWKRAFKSLVNIGSIAKRLLGYCFRGGRVLGFSLIGFYLNGRGDFSRS